MKKTIVSLNSKIEKMSLDEFAKYNKELGILTSTYQSMSFALSKRLKRQREQERDSRVRFLMTKFKYVDPYFPYVNEDEELNEPGEDGSCCLFTEPESKELFSLISSYFNNYVLEWSGPGQYIIETSYEFDHDRDPIYTATIKKVDSK